MSLTQDSFDTLIGAPTSLQAWLPFSLYPSVARRPFALQVYARKNASHRWTYLPLASARSALPMASQRPQVLIGFPWLTLEISPLLRCFRVSRHGARADHDAQIPERMKG